MVASKAQLSARARRLEIAVRAASMRLDGKDSPLVVALVTNAVALTEWSPGELPPTTVESALVIEIFKSHRLDSDNYAALKLVPELGTLVVAAAPLGKKTVFFDDGVSEVHGDMPIVFTAIGAEELIHFYNGNQVRSIIALVNKAR